MNKEFLSMYFGTFAPTISDNALEAARAYEIGCEWFDEEICTGRNERGVAMPANGREQGLINRHAKTVWEITCKNYYLSGKELHQALRHYRGHYEN